MKEEDIKRYIVYLAMAIFILIAAVKYYPSFTGKINAIFTGI
ncbi:hypothetical protein [uncultured Methanolobus sp.]|nr:hypothetical protein [uncultured Methanolobus sp.]